jgi:catechol 2,3-dioxygenase-like lactoylglutathione lyase family enzyme
MPWHIFAGLRVSDLGLSRAWYEKLLGSGPTFVPNDTEVVWDLADLGAIYLEESHHAVGGGLVTIFVDDLDAVVDGAASRGVEPASRETYGNGVRKVVYLDPDGNEVGFGGEAVAGATPDP